MSDVQNSRKTDSDEVTLVDIIAVCLRYRKLILGLPLIAAVVSVLVLYIMPLAGVNLLKTTYTATVSTVIAKVPDDLPLTIDPAKALEADFASVSFVEEAYVKVFPEIASKMAGDELSNLMRKGVVNKQLKYSYSKDSSIGTLMFVGSDKKKIREFASLVWSQAIADIMGRINQEYDASISVLKGQIAAYEATGKSDASVAVEKATTQNKYQLLLAYKQNKSFPFLGDQRVTVTSESKSQGKMVLIIILATLFVAIVAAFVANAARGIRRNPEDMAKLKAALEGED